MDQKNSRICVLPNDEEVRLSFKTIQMSKVLYDFIKEQDITTLADLPDRLIYIGIPSDINNPVRAKAYLERINILSLTSPKIILETGKYNDDAVDAEYRQLAKKVYEQTPAIKKNLKNSGYMSQLHDLIVYANYIENKFVFYLLINYFIDVINNEDLIAPEIENILYSYNDIGHDIIDVVDMGAFYNRTVAKNPKLATNSVLLKLRDKYNDMRQQVEDVKNSSKSEDAKYVEIAAVKKPAAEFYRLVKGKLTQKK